MEKIYIFSFILLLIVIFIVNLVLLNKYKKEILNKIKLSIEPKFLEIAISPNSNKMISLAIDIWRLEEKIINIKNINNNDKEKLDIAINRVKKFIEENNILIKSYTWEKYSDEINFYELKWLENTNEKEKNNIIKDTIEPAVFINWNIIKTAKIIIYKLNS